MQLEVNQFFKKGYTSYVPIWNYRNNKLTSYKGKQVNESMIICRAEESRE